jgi:hypothetical protein
MGVEAAVQATRRWVLRTAAQAMNTGDGSTGPWMWRTTGGATRVVGDVVGDER